MKKLFPILAVLSVLGLATLACIESTDVNNLQATVDALQAQINPGQEAASPNTQVVTGPADVEFTLKTGGDGHSLVFFGVGGDIDGVANPTLVVEPGQTVQITLINGQAAEHDLRIDEFGVATGSVKNLNEEKVITFVADEAGSYAYYCGIIGHRAAGMEGTLQVGAAAETAGVSITKNPADLPGPVGDRAPQLVQVSLTAQEIEGQLADGVTYPYFTFNGTVPGPFVRARVGDTVEVTLTNETSSAFTHSIDLHAVNGPGGGAVYTQVAAGETKVFTFEAMNPGIYVYHCATPSVPHHIAGGMYGLILIEPEGGLPPVDREFYVMQGEIYTSEPFGTSGLMTFSHEKLLNETPEYFVFNGAAGALAGEENMLHANVGETVRIFFGVGGPNFTSSFHVIGEIFDRVYPFGSFTSEPLTNVQTISVAPGGAWAVEFTLDVPGDYILVDHALSRLERGLVGMLHVEGADNPDVFHDGPADE
jgi:nitrite reductase (NO-forming)